ncbi:hypothetical protein SKAU_G00394110 [Synaphobranchus kaupii]|uniref:Uncharacterized protein n=1 Tax=Synaphobranchus kaupii TaxID=118154 RepID=A0A9Q1EC34_SYNKA|nr:hypothetical protein SKAU_G00394110 [Synaphobranchus kaupii]
MAALHSGTRAVDSWEVRLTKATPGSTVVRELTSLGAPCRHGDDGPAARRPASLGKVTGPLRESPTPRVRCSGVETEQIHVDKPPGLQCGVLTTSV